jgi:hypothetical protein
MTTSDTLALQSSTVRTQRKALEDGATRYDTQEIPRTELPAL